MKLKNTLGLYIAALVGSVQEDSATIELYKEHSPFDRLMSFRVIVGAWVVHRFVVEFKRAAFNDFRDVSDWFPSYKDIPKEKEFYMARKVLNNGQSGVPTRPSGYSSLTADCLAVGASSRPVEVLRTGIKTPFSISALFDNFQPTERMIQCDVDSWIFDRSQPLPHQIPVRDFVAKHLKETGGGFRRGEMITHAAFTQVQGKVDLTKHYLLKGD